MRLTFMHKDSNSIPGNCPAMFDTDTTDRHGDKVLVINGWELDPETQANVTGQADNELAVAIPSNVLTQWAETAGWTPPSN